MMRNNKRQVLEIVASGHRYIFVYEQGEEKDLWYSIIERGRDERFNLTILEALHVIRVLGMRVRANKPLNNFTIDASWENTE